MIFGPLTRPCCRLSAPTRPRRRGQTLIEIMASTGILSLIILLSGQVFNQVGKVTDLTTTLVERDAAVMTLSSHLRHDLAAATPDGLLVMANATPYIDANGQPAVYPPVLMFTATGRFVSQTGSPSGLPVTANAAVIVYTLEQGQGRPTPTGQVLTRRAYLLTGSGGWPRMLADETGDPNCLHDRNPLSRSDCLVPAWGMCPGWSSRTPH